MFFRLSGSRLASKCDPDALSPVFQEKYEEAEPLYKRTQEIFEKSLGRDHPNVAAILNNRAALLSAQVRVTQCFLLEGVSRCL